AGPERELGRAAPDARQGEPGQHGGPVAERSRGLPDTPELERDGGPRGRDAHEGTPSGAGLRRRTGAGREPTAADGGAVTASVRPWLGTSARTTSAWSRSCASSAAGGA